MFKDWGLEREDRGFAATEEGTAHGSNWTLDGCAPGIGLRSAGALGSGSYRQDQSVPDREPGPREALRQKW